MLLLFIILYNAVRFVFYADLVKSDNEKESSPVQPVNPRRKRPKRRSTGAVQFENEVKKNVCNLKEGLFKNITFICYF